MKTALVTTTINIPRNIEGYLTNFATNGYTDDVEVIVIGDLKSPPETQKYLDDLQEQTGYPISYWGVDRQRQWLKELPKLDRLLPYNSVQRRNLGYLQATMNGAECIISIDDDNFATEQDYLGGHGIIGQVMSMEAVSSSSRWFNSGSILQTSPAKPLYHRGFPTSMRGVPEELSYSRIEGRFVVNAGMWLGTPDADAMSHLDCPVEVIGFRNGFEGRLAVAHGTNMVFNSQNTSFHRDLLPCLFLMPMGDKVGELVVGRYDDIWMSIFIKKIVDHMGDYVSVGIPFVRQERNDHDLLQDMLVEIPAMRITNKLIPTLDRIRVSGNDYHSCYAELVEQLRSEIPKDNFSVEEREYLDTMLNRMQSWSEICEKIQVGVA